MFIRVTDIHDQDHYISLFGIREFIPVVGKNWACEICFTASAGGSTIHVRTPMSDIINRINDAIDGQRLDVPV